MSPKGADTITVYDDLGRVTNVKHPAVTGGADPSVATDGADATRVVEEQVYGEDRSGTKRGFPGIVRRYSPVLKDPVPKAGRTGAGLLYGTDGTITYTHATQIFTYDRDGLDRPLKITQPQQGDGGEEEFLYDTNKERVKAHKDVTGVWTVYTYDSAGRVETTLVGATTSGQSAPVGVDSRLEKFVYTPAGDVKERWVDYGGDGAGQILEETRDYDGFGRQVKATQVVTGQIATTVHDAQGRIAGTEVLAGDGQAVSRTKLDYDAGSGELASTTDLLRNATTIHLTSEKDRKTVVTDPMGAQQETHVDGAGRVIESFIGKGADGLWSATTYDADSNPIATSTGRSADVARGHFGAVTSITDPHNYAGTAPAQFWNHAGQVVRTRRPELDQSGQKSQRDTLSSGFGAPALELDEVGNQVVRMFAEQGAVREVREIGKDATDIIVRVTQKRETATGSNFGALVTETTQALKADLTALTPARTISYTVDAAGKRATMKLPSGLTTTYSYLGDTWLNGATRSDGKTLYGVGLDGDYRLPVSEDRWGGGIGRVVNRTFTGHEHSGLLGVLKAGDILVLSQTFERRGLPVQQRFWTDNAGVTPRTLAYDNMARLSSVTPMVGDLFAGENYPRDVFGNLNGTGSIDGAEFKWSVDKPRNRPKDVTISDAAKALLALPVDTPSAMDVVGSIIESFTYKDTSRRQPQSDGNFTYEWDDDGQRTTSDMRKPARMCRLRSS